MSLLFGYLTLACFILLAVKYPLRIAGAHKANALLMKLHEAASGGFLLFALIHVFFTFKALAIHGVWLPVMGAAALLTSLAYICMSHDQRYQEENVLAPLVFACSAYVYRAAYGAVFYIIYLYKISR